jgi:putative addiction module CopG family antidote
VSRIEAVKQEPAMSVDIPPQFASFVQQSIASGRFESESAMLSEALKLLALRERERKLVEGALDEFDRGEYIELDDEGLRKFLEDAQRQALDELRVEQSKAL